MTLRSAIRYAPFPADAKTQVRFENRPPGDGEINKDQP